MYYDTLFSCTAAPLQVIRFSAVLKRTVVYTVVLYCVCDFIYDYVISLQWDLSVYSVLVHHAPRTVWKTCGIPGREASPAGSNQQRADP